MDRKYYIEGLKTSFRFLYPYFSILNLILLVTYAFRDSVYTFLETIRFHFLFYYLFFLVPLILAIVIGKRLLFTEYPKLVYIAMPIAALLPFLLISPSRCSFLSCNQTHYSILLVITVLLSIRFSFRIGSDHGEYMEFDSQRKSRQFSLWFFSVMNVIVFASLPFLNLVHATNDNIIADLPSYTKEELPVACDKIRFNLEKKALCLNELAMSTNNAEVCAKIRGLMFENEDADRCYHNLAILNNNIALCNRAFFEDMRYACYGDFAPLTTELCANIDDEQYKATCSKDCKEISNEDIRDACYLSKSAQEKTGDFCASIVNANKQKQCYDEFFKSEKDCQAVEIQNMRDTCFDTRARSAKDVSVCSSIFDITLREQCITYSSIAIDQCDVITTSRIKEICQANHATNAEQCESFALSLSKDVCYASVAKVTNDARMCSKINDINRKAACVNSFE